MVHMNNDREQAYREATTFLMAYYGIGAMSRERPDLWLAYGPPAAVIEKIQAYLEAGCTTLVLRFVAPNRGTITALYERSPADLSCSVRRRAQSIMSTSAGACPLCWLRTQRMARVAACQ